jgi:hypothetical protein
MRATPSILLVLLPTKVLCYFYFTVPSPSLLTPVRIHTSSICLNSLLTCTSISVLVSSTSQPYLNHYHSTTMQVVSYSPIRGQRSEVSELRGSARILGRPLWSCFPPKSIIFSVPSSVLTPLPPPLLYLYSSLPLVSLFRSRHLAQPYLNHHHSTTLQVVSYSLIRGQRVTRQRENLRPPLVAMLPIKVRPSSVLSNPRPDLWYLYSSHLPLPISVSSPCSALPESPPLSHCKLSPTLC